MKRSRRRFLKTMAAAAASPWVVPGSVFGSNPPSERVTVGVIGCGNQTRVDVPSMLRLDDVQITAVCDVNRGSHDYRTPEHYLGREPVQKKVNDFYAKKFAKGQYRGCDAYADFRQLLARDDIDAVMLVVPDHWHALMTCLAAKAKKDIYCQKPLSLTVHDGQQMVKAVRKYNVVLQTGSQYRSDATVRHVAELVRNGRIGQVKRAMAVVNSNGSGPGVDWKPMPVPEGFDYDMWLGPAPAAPYHVDRCLYRFRYILDYSGGQVTNTGHHANDIVQFVLGKDGTGPVEFEDLGSEWPAPGNLWNTATKTAFRALHADGIELICRTQEPGFGARFEGTDGWIEYRYRKILCEPESLKDSVIGPDEIHLPVSDNHYRNFIDAVKARRDPIEPVEVGHRTVSICHLGNIAMRLKRKFRWDPVKEEVIGDDEAAAMLRRPYRGPWSIETV